MNQNFRLLFLSSDKHPARRVDVSVLFAEKLAGRGHQIDFVLQSESDCSETFDTEWEGCRVRVGSTDNGTQWYARIKKHLASLWLDIRAIGLIHKRSYDFVQLKDKYLSSLFIIPACRLFGVRFIYWLSFPFPEESLLKSRDATANYPVFYWFRGRLFDLLFYRFIVKMADFIFVQSEQMKHDLMACGVPAEKMFPVPMGVSLDEFPADIPTRGDTAESPIILYLGTLARVRKMDFLIRVFERVTRRIPEARLHLVGGGDDDLDMELLVKEARRLKVEDKVLFTGMRPVHEALEFVRAASVCVSPFYPTPVLNSTSPTKLVEYMAMGKAVVANDHPEQQQVIDESGAGLCVPYDEAAFANALIVLLGDPVRCDEMGYQGRKYVEQNRTYERIADEVERQYQLLREGDKGLQQR